MGLEIIEHRKEKRWRVYSRPHWVYDASYNDISITFFDTIYGRTGSDSFVLVADPSRPSWVLELETISIKEAKEKVEELAKVIGIDNVRLERVVDISTKLLPD